MSGNLTAARRHALELVGRIGHARVGMGTYECTDDDPIITPAAEGWLLTQGYVERSGEGEKRVDLTEAGLRAFTELPPPEGEDDPGDEPAESIDDRTGASSEPDPDPEVEDVEDVEDAVDGDDAPIVLGGQLPEFEGIVPIGTVTTINGSSQRISRAIHYGESGYLVVKWEANDIGHKKTADGMKRHQKLVVADAYELTGHGAKRLFNQLAEEHRRATEPDPLPFKSRGDNALVADFIAGRTDGSGVVVTPEELADLGITDTSALVVVWADGARRVWPDDFSKESMRPLVGERLDVPGGAEEQIVVELIDHVSGRVLATWDDEDQVPDDDAPGAGEEA